MRAKQDEASFDDTLLPVCKNIFKKKNKKTCVFFKEFVFLQPQK